MVHTVRRLDIVSNGAVYDEDAYIWILRKLCAFEVTLGYALRTSLILADISVGMVTSTCDVSVLVAGIVLIKNTIGVTSTTNTTDIVPTKT